MASVLNRTTKEFIPSVNTPDYPSGEWIVEPDLSAVMGFSSKYWNIVGDTVTLMTQVERDALDDAEFEASALAENRTPEHFGDGIDGDFVVNSNITLTRDVYPNRLLVQAGFVLTTANFRVIAKRSIVVHGTIRCNGGNAAGATAGTAIASGTMDGGQAGAAGGTGAGASTANLTAVATPAYGGRGGSGGNSGATAGGTAGNVITDSTARTRPRSVKDILDMVTSDVTSTSLQSRIRGGTGGGAGAGDGANAGGGGGGGGGLVVLAATNIIIGPTGVVEARGGNGANGVAGNAGGGGGGGGGICAAVYLNLRNRGSISVAAGTQGNGSGTGIAGQPGNVGRLISLPIFR